MNAQALPEPLIKLESISKSFGATKALSGVSLEIAAGSVHALVGENGAGKSTLMKILMGIHQPDVGEIHILGQPRTIVNPIHAQSLGISIVFQEIELCGNLTIRENLFLGRELTRRGQLDFARMSEMSDAVLRRMDMHISSARLVETLSVAQKQMVQIARAILYQPRVLILDEPTSSLTPDGVKALFRIIRELHDAGVTVLYISHKLEEIFEIADTVTVLRDGCVVATRPVREVTPDILVQMMVGRELDLSQRPEGNPAGVMLETRRLSGQGFRDVDLSVRTGAVTGIAGLVGSGRTELVETLFGIRPVHSGVVLFDGRDITRTGIQERIRQGMALVPEDRQQAGLIFTMVLRENLSLPLVAIAALGRDPRKRGMRIARSREHMLAEETIRRMRIVAAGSEAEISSLSGGNQQKVVIGKWLGTSPRLLILDEPTRGIDVGAKAEIHEFIRGLSRAGHAVLVVSSDLPELLALCDVIYVMKEGCMQGCIPGAQATEEAVMALAVGAAGPVAKP